MRNRPWVEKFQNGEYLRKYKGYDPYLIGGLYSENIGIGEEKFKHCMGDFSGIGDVNWWIKAELDKLTEEELKELELICKYKTYLKNFINIDIINKFSKLFDCEFFHFNRTDEKDKLALINYLNDYYKLILKSSEFCRNEKTFKLKEQKNIFNILTFEEFKNNK